MNKSQYDEVMKIKTRLTEIMEGENKERNSSDWNEEQNEQSESFCEEIDNAICNLDDIEEFEEIPDENEEEEEEEETEDEVK